MKKNLLSVLAVALLAMAVLVVGMELSSYNQHLELESAMGALINYGEPKHEWVEYELEYKPLNWVGNIMGR